MTDSNERESNIDFIKNNISKTEKVHFCYIKVILGKFSRWPHKICKISIEGNDCFLWPHTRNEEPMLIIPCKKIGYDITIENLGLRFLSYLSWIEDTGYDSMFYTGSYKIFSLLRNVCLDEIHFNAVYDIHIEDIEISFQEYESFNKNEKVLLALALYREALNTSNVFYQSLSFYKIFNILHDKSSDQKKWIKSNYKTIKEACVRIALDNIFKREPTADIGEYLYNSGRCAISHAYTKDSINPDKTEHRNRIKDEVDLVKALARLMIENEFGVNGQETIREKSVLKLRGFKDVLGKEIMDKIYSGNFQSDQLSNKIKELIPSISLKLRYKPEHNINNDLITEKVRAEKEKIFFKCLSKDGRIRVRFYIDFKSENVEFLDFPNCFSVFDKGDLLSDDLIVAQAKFIKALIGNGILEVWTGTVLLDRAKPISNRELSINLIPQLDDIIQKRDRS